MSKYIIKFYKGERVKYVSHLDIIRMIGRTMRRADLQIKHSQGFNPHPLLSFAHPLGVGISSMGELMEIELENDISPRELALKLDEKLPDAFKILAAKKCFEKSPFSRLTYARYEIVVKGNFDKTFLGFLQKDEIIMPKKTKSGVKDTDIRPFIERAEIISAENGKVEIDALLKCGGENLKPELFIQAGEKFAGCEADEYFICRRELLNDEKQPLTEF